MWRTGGTRCGAAGAAPGASAARELVARELVIEPINFDRQLVVAKNSVRVWAGCRCVGVLPGVVMPADGYTGLVVTVLFQALVALTLPPLAVVLLY
jgi:hypothetical protein